MKRLLKGAERTGNDSEIAGHAGGAAKQGRNHFAGGQRKCMLVYESIKFE
ncbi:hypothetical protein [Shinella sp. M31]